MYLVINEEISNATVNKILEKLLTRDKADASITVYINSQGGDPDCGYAIYEMLRLSGCDITTYAINEVYSSAIVIYLVGENRYATDYSTFMIHEPYHEYGKEGMSMDSKYYKDNLKELQDSANDYFKLISTHTQLTPQKIKNYISKTEGGEWYFKSALAKKIGLVTRIGVILT